MPTPLVWPLTLIEFLATDPTHNSVTVVFPRNVINSADLVDASRYTVIGPSSVTVASVLRVSDTSVILSLAGSLLSGLSYSLSLTARTAVASDDGSGNSGSTSATFLGVGDSPHILDVRALSEFQILVVFSKLVRMVSSLNPDDALNPLNYSISSGSTPVNVSSVSANSDKAVVLNTTVMQDIPYTLDVENIKDLAGNVVS